MDPITQGVLGGIIAQTKSNPKDLAKAATLGALAGMAPDLDVLIRSPGDPLLALEYHRHFTHSLFFTPFGGLICALVLHPLLGRRWGLSWWQTLMWCWLGYATHGLLDACTSYGTQLLWPVSQKRFAWDTISVIDPLITIPMLALTLLASRFKRKTYAYCGILWGAVYMGLAYVQHERALALGHQLAQQRGHAPLRLEAKPSFANIVVWKIVYETEDHFYVDAVNPGLRQPTLWPGDDIAKLNTRRDLPWLTPGSQQANDIERFRWFSDGYIAQDKQNPFQVVDIRYSMLPQQIAPLWGIRLSPDASPQEFAEYYTQRDNSGLALKRLIRMMFAPHPQQ
ncbi:metal-dependent hydrolase [Aestuariicella hydrocarbonica]|uniref:Metal-dependent hydrolase n=1 Tax=Pseudomaricurvus hydrocarbonicus TaxID=1470433 RepID=A0A9E5MM67_9GAMM|nr:metal-dependent hydrolase [Aestuariicella hydrocarbonica]NHO65585.1 metal-dependent hydrolase [Aestuariicella hydrocarbonica]